MRVVIQRHPQHRGRSRAKQQTALYNAGGNFGSGGLRSSNYTAATAVAIQKLKAIGQFVGRGQLKAGDMMNDISG